MVRERRRLLIAPARLADRLILEPAEAHYVSRVLRLRPGDELEVVDGEGGLWRAVLLEGPGLELRPGRQQPLARVAPPAPRLVLAVAVPRHDADTLWRMATELGADRLQPLLAERRSPALRLASERWRGIAREAVEQCERLWHPEVLELAPAAAWFTAAPPGDGTSLRLIATTREQAPPLESLLASWPPSGPGQERGPRRELALAIGPEGGWSATERQAASAGGWRPVGLGPAILRTSTAAVAGLARLAAWRDAFSEVS